MKNPPARFGLLTSIVLSALISACGPRPYAAVTPTVMPTSTSVPTALPDSAASLPTNIRIVHTWIEQRGEVAVQHVGYSLGTAIAPGVILTHDHFDLQPESRTGEALTFIAFTGQTFTLTLSEAHLISIGCIHTLSLLSRSSDELAAFYVTANTGCKKPESGTDGAVVAIDLGTQLIHLPTYMTPALAPLGDHAAVDQLAEGEWLTVNYWDETGQRLAEGHFQILRLSEGVATLADPQCLIRPGDSGGGAYRQGQLVGNTWARYIGLGQQSLGQFDVALVPAEARRPL